MPIKGPKMNQSYEIIGLIYSQNLYIVTATGVYEVNSSNEDSDEELFQLDDLTGLTLKVKYKKEVVAFCQVKNHNSILTLHKKNNRHIFVEGKIIIRGLKNRAKLNSCIFFRNGP